MNQTFNLKRFSQLFAKHTVDNYKTYLMAFFVLLGVLFLSIGFVTYVNDGDFPPKAQIPFFTFVLLVAGSIFTSIIFSDLGNKKKAISILTLPASHLEKYLIGWTYSFIIFQLLFVPAFYLIMLSIQQLASLKPGFEEAKLLNLFSTDYKVYTVFGVYAIIHALTLWGSIFFEKYHFIKTAFIFFIGIFTLSYFNMKFMSMLLGEHVVSAIPFGQVNMRDGNTFWNVKMSEKHDLYVGIVFLIIIVMLWACSFYRLKEKEV